MIRQLMFLALAGASLASCDWSRAPPPPPPPVNQERPRPVAEDRFDWIAPDPECRGSMHRGEWLVCDNQHLRDLHRTLAGQWAEARPNAERGATGVMRRQQEALLAERNRCEDATCVATAYRRYLSGTSNREPRSIPTPAPSIKPTPRQPRNREGVSRGDDRRPLRLGESCAAELGGSASAYLVRQCRVVNGRWDRSCTADRSCDDLRDQIVEGCSSGSRKPGFCNRR